LQVKEKQLPFLGRALQYEREGGIAAPYSKLIDSAT